MNSAQRNWMRSENNETDAESVKTSRLPFEWGRGIYSNESLHDCEKRQTCSAKIDKAHLSISGAGINGFWSFSPLCDAHLGKCAWAFLVVRTDSLHWPESPTTTPNRAYQWAGFPTRSNANQLDQRNKGAQILGVVWQLEITQNSRVYFEPFRPSLKKLEM